MKALFACCALFCLSLLPSITHAAAKQVCIYMNEHGVVQQTNSIESVPPSFRVSAKCFAEKHKVNQDLAPPEQVTLEGTVRRENIATSLGHFELRWQRKVELLFGRTPQRALADAAAAVNRALLRGGFASALTDINEEWKVVFMDEELPEAQIPSYLVSNCHPAWMTPPSNLYVVAQRVVAGCDPSNPRPSTSVADAELAHILIHEIGHALEYRLLKGEFESDRMRAEGFASWFEQYASDFASIILKGSISARFKSVAQQSFAAYPAARPFAGTLEDYARASMIFNAIVKRRGVRGLMDVYATMSKRGLDFAPAIRESLGWSEKRLNEEVISFVQP